MGLTATENAVDLVEEGREGIRLLLIHFRPRRKIYSLPLRRVTISHSVQLRNSLFCAIGDKKLAADGFEPTTGGLRVAREGMRKCGKGQEVCGTILGCKISANI